MHRHFEARPFGSRSLAGLLGNDLSSLSTLEEIAERIRTTHCCGTLLRPDQVPGEGNPAPG